MTERRRRMEEERKAANFIEAEINKDIANHVYANDRVLTRFPPEPNGYLHIGHVKSICLNFGIGQKYHGETNVRFDDTNPAKEEVEYVNSILEDVKWLGFQWKEPVHYASDYFPQLYEFACKLIRMGLAYVDDQTSEEIHDTRGDLKHPGKESPYRNRSVEENLKLFQEMKEGKYRMGKRCFAPRSIWLRRIWSCEIRSFIVCCMRPIIERGIPGAFIRSMTLHIRSLMPSKGSHTPSVRWSLKNVVRFTTGVCRHSTGRKSRARSNLPAST